MQDLSFQQTLTFLFSCGMNICKKDRKKNIMCNVTREKYEENFDNFRYLMVEKKALGFIPKLQHLTL